MLVDELAHTNAPGARHAKRWQDVEELLDAGIDVYTTLNVQHVESLNDVVAQITGVVVRETVPDSVLEQADEVELVDLPPDELLERLREGKVYVPGQAEEAMRNFFRKGNLIALRELALRRTAERVDAQMRSVHARARDRPDVAGRRAPARLRGPEPVRGAAGARRQADGRPARGGVDRRLRRDARACAPDARGARRASCRRSDSPSSSAPPRSPRAAPG